MPAGFKKRDIELRNLEMMNDEKNMQDVCMIKRM